jgi:hypothetical protein
MQLSTVMTLRNLPRPARSESATIRASRIWKDAMAGCNPTVRIIGVPVRTRQCSSTKSAVKTALRLAPPMFVSAQPQVL